MNKQECDKEYEHGELIISDDKCSECIYYYSCIYVFILIPDIEYGELNG